MSHLRKTLILVTLFTLVAMLFPAASDASTGAHRTRSGTSRWAPQTGNIRVEPYNGSSWNSLITFANVSWGDRAHYEEAEGYRRAMEWKTDFPTDFVNGYHYQNFSASNFPSGARPYRDTSFSDFGTSSKSYGYGLANTAWLAPGVAYAFGYAVSANSSGRALSGSTRVRVVAASEVDDDALVGCMPNDAYCVFPDYSSDYLRARQFTSYSSSVSTMTYTNNFLYNQSFEEGLTKYTMGSGNNFYVYCNGLGFASRCYLEFNRGSASVGSVWQDVPFDVRASDNYTAEVQVRCPVNQGQCPFQIEYSGLGGIQETRAVAPVLPSDGYWYLCKLDMDHGASSGFAYNHTGLRFKVQSNFGGNLNVDFTTLALVNQRTPHTTGDPSPKAQVTPACVRNGIYDS